MKNYIKKVIVFLIPIAVVLFIPSWILFKSGEAFYNIDKIVDSNSIKPYVLGYAYNGKGTNYEYFKFQKTIEIRPDVLVLGSSRVLQFQDKMFHAKFYNAGFTVGTIDDYLTFLKQLPKAYNPKLLILGVDQWMFNGKYLKSKEPYASNMYTKNKSMDVDNGFLNILNVYKDAFHGKINYQNLSSNSDTLYLGLNAVVNKKGFRNDGSFAYGINHKYSDDFSDAKTFFKRELSWINDNEKYFTYADEVDLYALSKYDELLKLCKEKGIQVIGFLPPLPKTVVLEMQKINKYEYIDEILKKVIPINQKYGFEFYDFTHVEQTSNDSDFIDGHHGDTKCYATMLNMIVNQNPESHMTQFLDLKNINNIMIQHIN